MTQQLHVKQVELEVRLNLSLNQGQCNDAPSLTPAHGKDLYTTSNATVAAPSEDQSSSYSTHQQQSCNTYSSANCTHVDPTMDQSFDQCCQLIQDPHG